MTLAQWAGGSRGNLLVSRRHLIAFMESYLSQRIVPVVADCFKTYEKERRRHRWWRRVWRWIGARLLGDPVVEPRSRFLDELHGEIAEAAEEAAAEQAVEAEPERPRTCVVCGSAALEPLNRMGGLKCDRGHVVEEPAAEPETVEFELVQGKKGPAAENVQRLGST